MRFEVGGGFQERLLVIAATRLISLVCVVATELALVQCFAIRFLTNPKTIMQS